MKILEHGGTGRLGSAICELAKSKEIEYIAVSFLEDIKEYHQADVIVDASVASAVVPLAYYARRKCIPMVICTTGLSEKDFAELEEISKDIAILISSNMSLGVAVLNNLVKMASEVLFKHNFNIEIVETHHNKKIDAPSGTAIMLQNTINESLNTILQPVYDRTNEKVARKANEIGIHSIRAGSNFGEHSIIFAGDGETIELTHKSLSREIFAKGALAAADFVLTAPPKIYGINDILA